MGVKNIPANGKTWKWDGTSWKLKHVTSGATSFIGLSDTPSTFTADKWIKVNSGGNGLEWANAPTGGSGINIKDDQGGTGGNPPSRQTAHQSIIMDVTNVSTDRFRIIGSNADATNAYFEGNSSVNYTMVLFKRIGDT